MSHIRFGLATIGIILVLGSNVVYADAWTGASTITKLEQTGKHNTYFHISPTPSGTGCSSAHMAFVQETGTQSYHPDYKDLAPTIMAAFLYGKTVDVLYDGCIYNTLKVTGIKVNQ